MADKTEQEARTELEDAVNDLTRRVGLPGSTVNPQTYKAKVIKAAEDFADAKVREATKL